MILKIFKTFFCEEIGDRFFQAMTRVEREHSSNKIVEEGKAGKKNAENREVPFSIMDQCKKQKAVFRWEHLENKRSSIVPQFSTTEANKRSYK